MTKASLLALAGFAFMIGNAPSFAAPPCKDAKGKFIKCPPAKPAPKRCVDAKKRFAKCGTPGAKPV